MHGCPCGFYGDPTRECRCTGAIIQRYLGKISGPLLDRIDLHVEVPAVPYQELRGAAEGDTSATIAQRVCAARALQSQRGFYNAHIPARQLRNLCALDAAGERTLEMAVRRMGLSARSHDRILKVARTIADLDHAETVSAKHWRKRFSIGVSIEPTGSNIVGQPSPLLRGIMIQCKRRILSLAKMRLSPFLKAWILSVLVTSFAAAGLSQRVTPPIREVVATGADIQLEIESSRLFEPVILTVHFRNKSSAEVVVVETALERNYTIEVFDEDGKPVELTERGKALQGPGMILKADVIKLKPGEAAPDTSVDLATLYNFTRGGRYTVSVARRIWTDQTVIERAYSDKKDFMIRP